MDGLDGFDGTYRLDRTHRLDGTYGLDGPHRLDGTYGLDGLDGTRWNGLEHGRDGCNW